LCQKYCNFSLFQQELEDKTKAIFLSTLSPSFVFTPCQWWRFCWTAHAWWYGLVSPTQ